MPSGSTTTKMTATDQKKEMKKGKPKHKLPKGAVLGSKFEEDVSFERDNAPMGGSSDMRLVPMHSPIGGFLSNNEHPTSHQPSPLVVRREGRRKGWERV